MEGIHMSFQMTIFPGTPILEVEPLGHEDVPPTAVPVSMDGRAFWYTWVEWDVGRLRSLVPRLEQKSP